MVPIHNAYLTLNHHVITKSNYTKVVTKQTTIMLISLTSGNLIKN